MECQPLGDHDPEGNHNKPGPELDQTAMGLVSYSGGARRRERQPINRFQL
jgi:hypothetical protein